MNKILWGGGYTKTLYKKILSKKYIHSTRDEHTKHLLESIDLKAINTGCPTMWKLTPEHCAKIPTKKAKAVILTLTDSSVNLKLDQQLINLLINNYSEVYFWPQGLRDMEYFSSMQNIECVHVVSPDIFSYDRLLNSVDSIDYIRTRLHAGIFAMQHKKRTFILTVDNRASDISKTYNINVFERSNMYGLREAIESDFQTKVEINLDNIIAWKQQFLIKEN
ncbi:polysaccharide pyruvyl transferase family protein [Hungatella hathewayi]|uniref:Polysaccharide pyruvyl transferase domain-containing protein n=1 Tax=Hungatella hathewayi TaxID=154046 RepID=A0AA37N2B4_9FIRM|nr:polysaccharide pyruvyl transferase family protein [Hungatella hathewayi]GKG98899.1 hypothetical protein CE91St55_08810 [Hungatella hathewayi]